MRQHTDLLQTQRSPAAAEAVMENIRVGGRVLVLIDGRLPSLAPQQIADLRTRLDHDVPEESGFVLHTSGSTGRPRSVLITAEQIRQYAKDVQAIYEMSQDDVVAITNHVESDYFIEEAALCVASGARHVVIPDGITPADPEFTKILESYNVTVVLLPLGAWRLWQFLLSLEGRQIPASIRLLVIGGEKLLTSDIEQLLARSAEGQRIINAYGPTETTIATHFDEISAESMVRPYQIGVPRPGVLCKIDFSPEAAHLVEDGTGELFIGGHAVASGYLGEPEATRKRFSVDTDGTRWFRTGDIVRLTNDGAFQYFGRLDRVIKHRGWPLDLGEVEAELRSQVANEYLVVSGISEVGLTERLLVEYDASNPPHMRPATYRARGDQSIQLSWQESVHIQRTPGAKVVSHSSRKPINQ